jgi:predicted alpha/beta superfamily hydrolase
MRRLVALHLLLAMSLAGGAAAAQGPTAVTVRIDMRDPIARGWFDPKSEVVGLRGGVAPLSWAATLPASDPDGDGLFDVTVAFPIEAGPATFVPHKFKVDGTDNPDDGWESGPNRPILLPRAGASVTRAFNAPGEPYPSTLAGDLRIHEQVPSKHVPARDVFVLLPPGYDRERTRRYPVLYMHDGQNLFDAARSFSGEWKVDETLAALVAARTVEPVIVVGVANLPGGGRIDDYTPTRATLAMGGAPTEAGGRAGAYGRFLVEELKPFVDRRYRTKRDAASTALGGSSLGGLVTLAIGLEHPTVYGTLLVVSPSVWWDKEAIVRRVASLRRRTRQRIWLDMGTREGDGAVEQARRLRDALAARGWSVGRDLRYVEVEGAGHDEASWAARFDDMLEFAFPAR